MLRKLFTGNWGSTGFNTGPKEIENITEKYNFHVHLYADDSQLYFSFDPKSTDDEEQLLNLKKCFADKNPG